MTTRWDVSWRLVGRMALHPCTHMVDKLNHRLNGRSIICVKKIKRGMNLLKACEDLLRRGAMVRRSTRYFV